MPLTPLDLLPIALNGWLGPVVYVVVVLVTLLALTVSGSILARGVFFSEPERWREERARHRRNLR